MIYIGISSVHSYEKVDVVTVERENEHGSVQNDGRSRASMWMESPP
jgi:hypothetical protein